MKPYTISKTSRSVASSNDKSRNVNLETKTETTENREKKIKTKIQGSVEDDLRKIKRKKRSSLVSHQDQMKQQTNKIQPFLEMSLDGRELSASSSTSTKILTLPRIDTPDKTRREDLTSLAALRTRTPPPGKTILDVSSNFRLRSSVDTSLSNSVKTVTRKSSRRSSIRASTESSKSKTDPEVKEASRAPTPEVMTSSANCCEQCRMREDKIRSNYDRMIMLSKRDRVRSISTSRRSLNKIFSGWKRTKNLWIEERIGACSKRVSDVGRKWEITRRSDVIKERSCKILLPFFNLFLIFNFEGHLTKW